MIRRLHTDKKFLKEKIFTGLNGSPDFEYGDSSLISFINSGVKQETDSHLYHALQEGASLLVKEEYKNNIFQHALYLIMAGDEEKIASVQQRLERFTDGIKLNAYSESHRR